MEDLFYTASTWILPVVLAITLHEAAHGYVARLFGDDTATRLGRVTLNPLRHIDRVGTVLIPGLLLLSGAPFLFGYAKPVPVDFRRLRPPRRGMIAVAMAGVAMNLVLAVIAALGLHGESILPEWVIANLLNAMMINVVLIVFNLVPILPLDGGRVVTGLLPEKLARAWSKTEKYGMAGLLILLIGVPMIAHWAGYAFSPVAWALGPVMQGAVDVLLRLTGHAL